MVDVNTHYTQCRELSYAPEAAFNSYSDGNITLGEFNNEMVNIRTELNELFNTVPRVSEAVHNLTVLRDIIDEIEEILSQVGHVTPMNAEPVNPNADSNADSDCDPV